MRARAVLAVAAALLAVAAGTSFAAELQPAQAVQPPQGSLAEAAGEVRDVNLLGRTIQVNGHAGLFPRKIVLGPESRIIMPDGSQGSIASIREGDRVQATYREAGRQNVADEVRVLYSQEQLVQPRPPAGAQAQPPQAMPEQPQPQVQPQRPQAAPGPTEQGPGLPMEAPGRGQAQPGADTSQGRSMP